MKFKLKLPKSGNTLSAGQTAMTPASKSSRDETGESTNPKSNFDIQNPPPKTGDRVNTKPWQGKTKREMTNTSSTTPSVPTTVNSIKGQTRHIKKDAGVTPVDLFDDLFDDVDPFEDLFVEESEITKAHGRAGKQRLSVVIEYDPSKVSGIGSLIMESIASRGTIPEDFDADHAVKWYQNLGRLDAKTLANDEDRWQMFVFAAEYLRMHGSPDQNREKMKHITGKVNPDWDETAENVAQDGRTLGTVDIDPFGPGVPVVGEAGIAHLDPPSRLASLPTVRESVERTEAMKVEKNRPEAHAVDFDAIRAEEGNPQLQIWRVANEYALKPRAEWEGKVDWMLEQKIKYCYSWIQEFGDITAPYPPDQLAIFWGRPSVDPRDKPKVDRRDAMTSKVIGFWRASVAKNGDGMNLKSDSYRTVLTAMALQKAIEDYVSAGSKFDFEGNVIDKGEEMEVQKAAKAYFMAHFPIKDLGAGPGPLSTSDPDFVEYLRLIRQYKLPQGTLLHEIKL